MRGYLSLFLALSTIGCVKVTETVLVYADATTPDGGQEPTDAAGPADAALIDSGLADSGLSDAAPVDSGPVADSGPADTGILDDCQLALGVSCATFEEGYLKASNTGVADKFGSSVALSDDGNTLAVGAYEEDSSAAGVGANQTDNSAIDSGAVYVFTRSGTTWSQQAYLKASNPEADDEFGKSLALSADGNTLAVGAPEEDSSATGVNGNQVDNTAANGGAVYVFVRTNTNWAQEAYLKASNTEAGNQFGWSVALSYDGDTLAAGSHLSGATGNIGAVYVFTRGGANWGQQAHLTASNAEASDNFGYSVSLSDNGNTLAVGALYESSNATGVGGDQTDNSSRLSGAAYIFTRNGTTWSQETYLKASNTDVDDNFGISISLSGDGNTLAIGASVEDSNSTGVNGNQADNSTQDSGAVYVFARGGTTWSQQAYIKASNPSRDDRFGWALALSDDGNVLAIGACLEDSNATGVNGNQTDNSSNAGAVYLLRRSGAIWTSRAYLKASNSDVSDWFGWSVALSGDGTTLAVGAFLEDSSATGVNGDQADNSALESGAVYVRRIAP